MFPIRDDNPTLGAPAITVVLIGLNVAAWILVQGMGAEPTLSQSVCELGLIPGELLGRIPEGYTLPMSREMSCVIGPPHWYTPLSSMFLHGGWLHLIGNMWFLWLFGNNIEDAMTRPRFVAGAITTRSITALTTARRRARVHDPHASASSFPVEGA